MNDLRNVPLTVKKERICLKISQQINRKLSALLKRKPTGHEISRVQNLIDKKVGIPSAYSDSASFEMLERKLEFVHDTVAQSWLK